MKYIDFLTNLKTEIKDANKGVGKTTADTQNYCSVIIGILNTFEEKMISVVNNDSYRISDVHIDAKNEEIFRSIVSDLLDKEIIMHKEDHFLMKYPESLEAKAIKETRSMMQTTRTLTEMYSGKNIVIVDKKGFRSYVNKIKKITNSVRTIDNLKNGEIDKAEENTDNDLNILELKTLKKKTTILYKNYKVATLGSGTHLVKLLQLFKKRNSWTLDVQETFFDLYRKSKSKHREETSVVRMREILDYTIIRARDYFKPVKYKISFVFPTRSTIKLSVKKVK